MTEQRAVIRIGPQGIGSHRVQDAGPGQIEGVRVYGPHGHPHVLPTEGPEGAWIEVLGAIPDSEITVSWRQEG